MAVGGEDGSVMIINVAARKIISSVNVGSAVNSVCWAADHGLYVGCDNGSVHRLTRDSDSVVWSDQSSSPVLCLRSHGQWLVVSRQDGSVTCQHTTSGQVVSLAGSDLEPVYSVSIAHGHIYTGSRDGVVRKYSISCFTSNKS